MTEVERLCGKHVGKSVLLDTNLLLVLLMGAFDPHLLGSFKRVSGYRQGDYDLLVRFLRSFTVLLTTPHILTEVSNLAGHLPDGIKSDWFRSFGLFLQSQSAVPALVESWTPAGELAATPHFSAFGIADAGISALSNGALVVTEDHRLSGVLRKRGVTALNFADLRSFDDQMRMRRE